MDAGPNAPGSLFHAGEQAMQTRAGVRARMDQRAARAVRDFMPDQHRSFFEMLPFVPIALEGKGGWPAATILTGPAGFISSPCPRSLRIAALPSPADPAASRLRAGAPIGMLGIDLVTRRRNRANGRIAGTDAQGFEIAVTQSFGNCAQYIQAREHEPSLDGQGAVAWERLSGMDRAARALIASADTFFVASGSEAGMDMSHRGGRPGFVRVDADVLTVPDFAGNRYFNTLGNFVLNNKAAVLFPDFSTGDLLNLVGLVEIIDGGEEVLRFAGAERLWRVRVVSGWRGRGVLPPRWGSPAFAPTTLATGQWGGGAHHSAVMMARDDVGGSEIIAGVHVQKPIGA
ncbi:MAG TPA: pyridoxamine 5'-phosphate oxidase family protein [Acetobacteraceae bacterium]|nr:pyridoxamine 5'-phosphate oxidase family protein [Acetobacteraceae bacterium]